MAFGRSIRIHRIGRRYEAGTQEKLAGNPEAPRQFLVVIGPFQALYQEGEEGPQQQGQS
jgi:hypothetical protein